MIHATNTVIISSQQSITAVTLSDYVLTDAICAAEYVEMFSGLRLILEVVGIANMKHGLQCLSSSEVQL